MEDIRHADYLEEKRALRQAAWERRHRVMCAYETGATTYREIGAGIGVGVERARQLRFRAERERRAGWRSPLKQYLAESDAFSGEIRAWLSDGKRLYRRKMAFLDMLSRVEIT